MSDATLQRFLRSIEGIKRHISMSNAMREFIAQRTLACKNDHAPCFDVQSIYNTAPDITEWKVIEHCSSVTQLYAVFEKFVHEILGWFLAYLETNVAYSALDQGFRDEHRRKLGQVLVELGKDRYKSLNLESVITDYANAISGKGAYRLLPDAILAQEQNLRLAELTTICNRCGIKEIGNWLSKHRVVKKFFADQSRQSDKIETELRQLIDYRNDAAHGATEVDSIVAPSILLEYAEFIGALGMAFFEGVRSHALKHAVDLGKTHLCGSVSEKYGGNIVVAVVEKQKFTVGDRIVLSGDAYCYEAKILSIHDQDIPQDTVTVVQGKELGFQLDVERTKWAELFYFSFG